MHSQPYTDVTDNEWCSMYMNMASDNSNTVLKPLSYDESKNE